MLPQIQKPMRQRRKDKLIDELFNQYEEKLPSSKEEFNYEILQNLEPVQVDNIYQQKKQSKLSRIELLNSPKNFHQRNASMMNLHQIREQDSQSFTNIFTPRGKNIQQINLFALKKPFLDHGERTPHTPKTPKVQDFSSQQMQSARGGQMKSKSHHIIPVDQVEESNYFEEIYQQKQLQLEENENEAGQNMPQHVQKEYTKRWGEVNVSMRISDRNLQQEVSQTMKTINNNLKQIVTEQEKKRMIRNLTSLDTIFKVAQKEVLEFKLIDLTLAKEKKPWQIKQSVQQSINKLSTLPISYTTSTEPNDYEINQPVNTNKFKKLNSEDQKFQLMYSRFIKKLHSPHLKEEALVKKKPVINKSKLRQLEYHHPKNSFQMPYQSLAEVLPENTFDTSQEATYMSEYLTKENTFCLPILQANRNIHNKINTIPNHESTLNSTLDGSKLSTTINTALQGNNNKSQFLHGDSRFQKSSFPPLKPSKPLNQSQSTKSIGIKKEIKLPKYLVPFKDLVINTWKGKIGPTSEENVLFSNCLGMLSLHKEMTECIPDIKEYQFAENSQYTAVPSKSTRLQKNAEKKFKKAIKSNIDTKQQLINLNIQQLDQVVEIEDPKDYLISDHY